MSEKVMAVVELLSQQNPFNGANGLADPPRPSEAAIPRDRPSVEQIPFIQQQINVLTYNHLPRTFFSLEKRRSLQSILLTAKEVLSEALPIRCLEATFVALHFTQILRDVDRIPLSFKSEANGNNYRHIVLVLRTRSTPALYGALGLSRKSTLMYKPLTFRSLFDVVMDYKREYEALGHTLADIKLGIAITHDEHSRWEPCWRYIAIKLDRFCEGAAAESQESTSPSSPPQQPAQTSSIVRRKAASPKTTPHLRKSSGFTGEGSVSSPNGGCMAVPPPLSLDASGSGAGEPLRAASSRGDVQPDRFTNDGGASSSFQHQHHHRHTSLSNSVSLHSPLTPYSASNVTNGGGNNSTNATTAYKSIDAAPDSYAPLAKLLGNYMRLLPTICEQFYRGVGTVDSSNRALKLCFMDLDTAEKDAGMENQRRLQYILDLQSPLSTEAQRVASTRQVKPTKKERAIAKSAAASPNRRGSVSNTAAASGGSTANGSNTSAVAGAKRRQMSCGGGRTANKRSSPVSPGAAGGDVKRAAVAVAMRRTRSPQTQQQQQQQQRTPPSPAMTAALRASPSLRPSAAGAAATNTIPPPPPALLDAPTSLSNALASSGIGMRIPLALEGTVVDARSICSSGSEGATGTEGYATPHRPRPRGAGALETSLEQPPPTPRNCGVRKASTPYDAFLRTPSSSGDLFSSPCSVNATVIAPHDLSP